MGHISLPWMIPNRLGKSKSSDTENALSRKRGLRTPTEGHTTAAQGDHGYDVRTLEADKPAVAGSVPLIWMFPKPSNADANTRLKDARPGTLLFSRTFFRSLVDSLSATQSVLTLITVTERSLFPLSSFRVVLLLARHLSLSLLASLSLLLSSSFLSSGFAIRPISLLSLVYLNFW